MKKHRFFCLKKIGTSFLFVVGLLIPTLNHAQIYTVHGIVSDKEGRLLYGISVSDCTQNTIVYTNIRGEFSIELLCDDSCDLIVEGTGFVPKEVRVDPRQYVTIILDHYEGPVEEHPESNTNRFQLGINSWFGGDFRDFDFSSFESTLGYYNVKALNTYQALIAFQIGLDIRNIFLAMDYGFGGGSAIGDDYPDSLNYEVSQTMYGLHVGYHVVNSRHLLFTPLLGLKLYRSRLIQSASEQKLDIEKYLNDPSLDLRFNQLTWFGGVMVQYKFQDEIASGWAIGGYVGYLGKVTSEPWVKSTNNRLINGNSIDVDPFNLGITLGFYFQ